VPGKDFLDPVWTVWRERVADHLDRILPVTADQPGLLHSAMRYSTLAVGKRFRAALVYAAGRHTGAADSALDVPACAVELVHTFSLIHDDLPAMDDDDLRRGQPTCHKAFDEATAILAGDALQALAFELLASDSALTVDAERRLAMCQLLASAAGTRGLAGGQALDLTESSAIGMESLANRHALKTGSLIRASVALGALTGSADQTTLDHLDKFADAIGLAYQVIDDVLDGTISTDILGKDSGSDRNADKFTYLTELGEQNAREFAQNLHERAISSLDNLSMNTNLLRDLAGFTIHRTH
jgi:farnesyl diphosphate synthase|tara:strand:+ start:105 stop:1001 length:897 start_codon:yes stop_codon:yes gene_type:complete